MHYQKPKLTRSLFSYQFLSPTTLLLNQAMLLWDCYLQALARHLPCYAPVSRRGCASLCGKQVPLNILFRGPDDTIAEIRIQEAGVGDSQQRDLIPS